MQLWDSLVKTCGQPKGQATCAGSVQGGQVRWGSLFNNEEFALRAWQDSGSTIGMAGPCAGMGDAGYLRDRYNDIFADDKEVPSKMRSDVLKLLRTPGCTQEISDQGSWSHHGLGGGAETRLTAWAGFEQSGHGEVKTEAAFDARLREAFKAGKLAVVMFGASWCGV